jgi:hypothetical protein
MTSVSSGTRFVLVAVGIALVASAGCSSSSAVTSERNDAVPIPAGATVQFRGAEIDASPKVDPTVPNDSVHYRIQQAIITQLRQKGYTLVDTTRPATFTVRYYLEVKTSSVGYAATAGGVSGPKVGGYKGYGYGYGQEGLADLAAATPDSAENVSFEVALVDERMGRTAWRGLFHGKPKSHAPSEKRINEVMAQVFTTLPRVP